MDRHTIDWHARGVTGCDKRASAPVSSMRAVTNGRLGTKERGRTVDADDHESHWTQLMEQSLNGDCAAYGLLLAALTSTLRRAIRARAQSVGLDAEDVVQEVLLALHLKRKTWVRGTPVAP